MKKYYQIPENLQTIEEVAADWLKCCLESEFCLLNKDEKRVYVDRELIFKGTTCNVEYFLFYGELERTTITPVLREIKNLV